MEKCILVVGREKMVGDSIHTHGKEAPIDGRYYPFNWLPSKKDGIYRPIDWEEKTIQTA